VVSALDADARVFYEKNRWQIPSWLEQSVAPKK
jgi:hypothetical protein